MLPLARHRRACGHQDEPTRARSPLHLAYGLGSATTAHPQGINFRPALRGQLSTGLDTGRCRTGSGAPPSRPNLGLEVGEPGEDRARDASRREVLVVPHEGFTARVLDDWSAIGGHSSGAIMWSLVPDRAPGGLPVASGCVLPRPPLLRGDPALADDHPRLLKGLPGRP